MRCPLGAPTACAEIAAVEPLARMRNGIAADAAITALITPSAPGKTTVSINTGFFEGATGVGLSIAHRLNTTVMPIYLEGSYANAGGSSGVGRVGMAVEF
jgi:hypothetical protein